ncbi:MAG: hypothetical protein K0S74_503 [Chlamydiales bacterium]|jgi:hypothetical protein|nr:hypothetical protein [Chlamydiales bacterium]
MNISSRFDQLAATFESSLNYLEKQSDQEQKKIWLEKFSIGIYTPSKTQMFSQACYSRYINDLNTIENHTGKVDREIMQKAIDKSLNCIAREVLMIKKFPIANSLPEVISLRNEVKQKILALQYRLGIFDDNQTEEINKCKERVVDRFKGWRLLKFELSVAVNLTDRQDEIFEKLHQYPGLMRLLAEDANIADNFFEWAIKYNNSVDLFAQFPSICNRMKNENGGRIMKWMGSIQVSVFTIERISNISCLCLTFRDHGKMEYRLNRNRHIKILSGQSSVKVDDILDDLAYWSDRSSFEISSSGIFCRENGVPHFLSKLFMEI